MKLYTSPPCVRCGKVRQLRGRSGKDLPRQRYCTWECYHQLKEYVGSPCARCGKVKKVYGSEKGRHLARQRYCSKACANAVILPMAYQNARDRVDRLEALIKSRRYGVPRHTLFNEMWEDYPPADGSSNRGERRLARDLHTLKNRGAEIVSVRAGNGRVTYVSSRWQHLIVKDEA